MTHRKLININWLTPDAEHAMIARHEAEIDELLPILGPLFGLAVIVFGLWDYFIDAEHALVTFAVRVAFVLLGALAYFPQRFRWTTAQRCCHIYWSHACAIILSEHLLKNGFLYGLTGVTCCLFVAAVIAHNLRSFLLLISLPSIMLAILGAFDSSSFEYINQAILYTTSALFSCVLMMVIRSFRRSAFSLETTLIRHSRCDPLTGAYNRSYLEELALREIAASRRHGLPLAVAMLDIDHFKRINDTYGHAIGDLAIKALVSSCLARLRKNDHFGRIGGEEFVCILPGTDAAGAMECAEYLRQDIAALRIATPAGTVQFTVSIGVQVLQSGHSNWSDLMNDADRAMYQAKNGGRNRICMPASQHQNTTELA